MSAPKIPARRRGRAQKSTASDAKFPVLVPEETYLSEQEKLLVLAYRGLNHSIQPAALAAMQEWRASPQLKRHTRPSLRLIIGGGE